MADTTPFELKLFQTARLNTERFEIEATSAVDAQAQADAIAKDKGLTKDFDWEITEMAPAEPEVEEEPTEPELR